MCLKEVHIFTFTNCEALERLVQKLMKNYADKIPEGVILKVIGIANNPAINMSGYTEQRSMLDYERLYSLLELGCINVEIFEFKNWKKFGLAVTKTKIGDDVFGLVRVEIQ